MTPREPVPRPAPRAPALLRGMVLAAVLIPGAPLGAQTMYVDGDAPAACACKGPAKNDNAACGTTEKPFSCIRDALGSGRPWDTIVLRDGTYREQVSILQGGASDAQRRTIRAEHPGRALVEAYRKVGGALYIHANFVTVQGLRITGGDSGIQIVGAQPGQTDAGTGVVVEDTEVSGNDSGVLLQRGCSGVRLSRLDIHHNDLYDGVKLDTHYPGDLVDTVIEACHIHHNHNNGILEINAQRTVVRDSEIDHNGTERTTHGLYLKGFQGLIQNNKIHDSSGYGLHLWAAPRGTADRHYIAENNDVYANGQGGIVLGGNPAEAVPAPPLPPGDGLPHFVEVRGNRVHDNPKTGLLYYGHACDDSANDNAFHDNLVYDNGALALHLYGVRNDATRTRLIVKDNVFSGAAWTKGAVLALFVNTSLDAASFDGNTFFMPGAESTTPVMRWLCLDCGSPDEPEVRYSFDQLRDLGLTQDNARRPDMHCGAATVFKLDARSRWTDPHLAGNPSTAPPR